MNNSPLAMAFSQTPTWILGLSFVVGILFSFLYLWLMWKSIQLASEKGKGFLAGTSLLRLGLFLLILILVAGKNPARAVLFFAGFIITRSVFLFYQKRRLTRKK